jgi:hypothetical protein
MTKFQFLSFQKTPNEKHIGIATVKIYDRIIARFKIIPTKDNSSFFPAPPSIKIDDKYFPCFQLDSNTEKQELDDLIKRNVNSALSGSSVNVQPTLFDQAPAMQNLKNEDMPNYLDSCPF